MPVLAVIPARYASSRFPGKPLALLGDKPVIHWVWDNVSSLSAIDKVVVATDDSRIFSTVNEFGGCAMMTSPSHRSGTDRCGEVLRALSLQGCSFDIVINVQGDEPFVRHQQLSALINAFDSDEVQIATLCKRISDVQELLSPNNVKVVADKMGNALYFSRQPIPFVRGIDASHWLDNAQYYKHLGIYAFRASVLPQLVALPQSPLEISESLEQLRWLENGFRIALRETDVENVGIDTPDDLVAAARLLPSLL